MVTLETAQDRLGFNSVSGALASLRSHQSPDMDRFADLEEHVLKFCGANSGCGVAVTLIDEGQIIYANAFGTLALDAPLAVASLSKPVFAYTALKLCEQGVLQLDRPLIEYLPQPYLEDEPLLSRITARQVLSHSTGFPNWRSESGLRIGFMPGSAFHYSTEGLIYLQTVIEHLTGQPLDEYIRHHIFEPLGMEQSHFVPEDLSTVQSFLPAGLRAYGGISLQTTAPDYARFMLQMMRVERDHAFQLDPTLLDEMLKPHMRVGNRCDLSWGLGWGLQHEEGTEDSFWHWGARRRLTRNFAMGYRTRQTGLAILTTDPEGLTLCREIAQTLLAHPTPFPAFRWLLPAEKWRADGLAES